MQMQRLRCFFCAVVCLVSKSCARRIEVDESRGLAEDASLSSFPDGIRIHGDFHIHNQCPFPINVMAQNGFVEPILHVQNHIAFGDSWHPPNKLQTKFSVSVGFEFEKGKEASYSLVKLGGIEGAKIVFSGSVTAAAAALTGTIGGGILVGVAGSALVGAGIICPLCVAGGLSASFLTAYGFASGIEMVGEMVLDTISDKSREFLRSRKRVMNSANTTVPLYTFEGLMFPDDELAYAAVSETISHWATHLQQTDRDHVGVAACSRQETAKTSKGLLEWITSARGDDDCVRRYASRIHLPDGVANIWVNTLSSKFSKSLWPAFHGDKHLYVRGGLSLPEYNEALGGWLVEAFTPIFLSEEERDKPNEESEFAACTQINPGMLDKFMSRCKKSCSKSAMGKDICEARCEEKLPSNSSGRGVCRGTYQSTRQMFGGLGEWVCCAAGPQTEADAEERLSFPKFCLLNSDCKPPEEGNDKHEGKWACAEAEVPKTKFWMLDKACWQAPVVADAGDDVRNLLDKFPGGTSEVSWSDNDEVPWM